MDKKPWYASRTIWTNLAALLGFGAAYGMGDASAEAVAGPAVLSIVNIFLRAITKKELGSARTD